MNMERSAISRLANLRQLIASASLNATIQKELFDLVEELETRLYATEQDIQLLKGSQKAQAEKIHSLETRYSQILYALSDRRRG